NEEQLKYWEKKKAGIKGLFLHKLNSNHDVVGSSPTAGATKHSLGMLFLHCKNIIKTKLFSCAV
ncbi:hypothetical protein, partial [Streptococcus anginosus]|uniref:hypothetical protein n=1 Tax=Streptococcus anginosus TaxID=1328 RepID=UPI002FF1F2C9